MGFPGNRKKNRKILPAPSMGAHILRRRKRFTWLENFIANKITWLLPGLTSQLFPTGKRTVADIAQLPVPNNATPFEIFQLKISDEALYEENGEVGSSPGRIFLSSAQSIIKTIKLNNLKWLDSQSRGQAVMQWPTNFEVMSSNPTSSRAISSLSFQKCSFRKLVWKISEPWNSEITRN